MFITIHARTKFYVEGKRGRRKTRWLDTRVVGVCVGDGENRDKWGGSGQMWPTPNSSEKGEGEEDDVLHSDENYMRGLLSR